MDLERLTCNCCGGDLTIKGEGQYECSYCGSVFEKDNIQKIQYILSNAFEQDKLERLKNARRVLYDATIKTPYPSKEKVLLAVTAVLNINPDDPFALAVSYSYQDDGWELANLLPKLQLDPATADQIYTWIMRDVSYRIVGPLSDFVQRHFANKDLMDKLTALENEAVKDEEGFYLSNAPRDVFVCYSSKDMPAVIHTIDLLEENGFICFAAFRNLRHGRDAKENYLKEIENAIDACKTFLFISSKSSRSPHCDAIKVELPYLIKIKDKPRVEFMIENEDEHTPLIAKKIIKEAFPCQERVHDDESLVMRIDSLLKEPIKEEIKQEEQVFDAEPVEDTSKDEIDKEVEEDMKDVLGEELDENNSQVEIYPEDFVIKNNVLIKYTGQSDIVYIPEGITRVDSDAFADFYVGKRIRAVYFPSTLKSLDDKVLDYGDYHFNQLDVYFVIDDIESFCNLKGRKNLSYHYLKIHLVNKNYKELKSVVIPGSISIIPDFCFYKCQFIESLIIPSNVSEIGQSAFDDCLSLRVLKIANGPANIRDCAFRNCESLKAISIPSSVVKIGVSAFLSCVSLKTVGLAYGITSIGESAFKCCSSLETINFPDSITEIGAHAFEQCQALTCALLPPNLRYIESYAFNCCNSLKMVNLPLNVKEIKRQAFYNCCFKAITIPKSVGYIEECALASEGLEKMVYQGTSEEWRDIKRGKNITGYGKKRLRIVNCSDMIANIDSGFADKIFGWISKHKK